jgi:hypothetical protein
MVCVSVSQCCVREIASVRGFLKIVCGGCGGIEHTCNTQEKYIQHVNRESEAVAIAIQEGMFRQVVCGGSVFE